METINNIKKYITGSAYLKLYRINKEFVERGRIKVFITITPNGEIEVKQSLGDRTVLGKGIIKGDSFPDKVEEWNSLVFMKSIIPDFISESGDIKAWFSFRYYNDGKEPTLMISQTIPSERREEFPKTNIGIGNCRTKQVKDLVDWIIDMKDNNEVVVEANETQTQDEDVIAPEKDTEIKTPRKGNRHRWTRFENDHILRHAVHCVEDNKDYTLDDLAEVIKAPKQSIKMKISNYKFLLGMKGLKNASKECKELIDCYDADTLREAFKRLK